MCSKRCRTWSTGGQPSISMYNIVFGQSMRCGRVMDHGYLWDVSRYMKPLGSAAVGPLQCAGYVVCDNRLARTVVAIMATNPRSLWTPLLWGHGSTTRSCTVCTFTLNLQWRQSPSSTLEAAYRDPQSTGMSFLGLAETEEQLPRRVSNSSCSHGEESPISTPTPTLNNWLWTRVIKSEMTIFRFVCRGEVNIAMEWRLRLQYLQRHTIAYVRTYLPSYNRLSAVAFERQMTIDISTSFVERKSTSPRRSVSSFETDSTTHDGDWEPEYGDLWRSSWTVCHLRRSSWLEVKTVDADSAIDYRA